MPIKTVIYGPPKKGLPYLIVTFASDGLKVSTASSSVEARTVVSERMIRRRRERVPVVQKKARQFDEP